MTHSTFLIAAAIGFLAAAPAMAEDGRPRTSLASLDGIGSANMLFLRAADAPAADTQRSRVTSLTVTFSAQVDSPPPPATPAIAALAMPAEAQRQGGTNLYGFTRDPRAGTSTPAGMRFADPSVVQAIKPNLAGQKLAIVR